MSSSSSSAAIIPAAIPVLQPGQRIGYVTDAEGNLDYFERYVALSTVVRYDAPGGPDGTGNKRLEFVDDACLFVFGGDVCDKGAGDIRLVRQLVSFKRRHPQRVFLLLGNRDTNKLRYTSELHPDVVTSADVADDRSFPYWIEPAAKRVTPNDYRAKKGGLPDTPTSRCLWMHAETMGADGLFEFRRKELALLAGGGASAPAVITDDDVLTSLRTSVQPSSQDHGAFMLDYMRAGSMAVRLGPHLFVHGAVTEANMGRAPPTGPTHEIASVDEWVHALNTWTQQQLDEHAARPQWGPARGSDRGGHGLLDYGVPNGFHGATVVYATNLDNGNAVHIKPAVAAFLARSNVHSVVNGHVPHGDCPLVIRTQAQRVITADTSYSDMAQPDNRGCAVSEVVLHADGHAHVHGVLKDGRAIEYRLAPPQQRDAEATTTTTTDAMFDPYIGKPLKDNSWVKAKLKGQDTYIVCRGEGFQLHVRELALASLLDELAQ